MVGEPAGLFHQKGGIRSYPLTIPTAQKAAYRLSGRLPEHVPQGNVYATDSVGNGSAPSEPEGVLVQLLADPLRLQGALALQERAKHRKSAANQLVAGEHAPVTHQPLVRSHRHQRVHHIVRSQLVAPAPLGRSPPQPRNPDVPNLHAHPQLFSSDDYKQVVDCLQSVSIEQRACTCCRSRSTGKLVPLWTSWRGVTNVFGRVAADLRRLSPAPGGRSVAGRDCSGEAKAGRQACGE